MPITKVQDRPPAGQGGQGTGLQTLVVVHDEETAPGRVALAVTLVRG